MGETVRRTFTATGYSERVEGTRQLLRLVYGLFPIVAGADKFTHLLADWTNFLPQVIVNLLPVEPQMFMYGVGIVEIVAGLLVLWRAEYGGYVVAAWLAGIAVTQVIGGNYDIAVRDLWIAVGALALARLSAGRR